jgi:chromate reductase
MPTLQQPEAYISGASKLFDDAGKLTNESTRELFEKLLRTFDAWIDANTKR